MQIGGVDSHAVFFFFAALVSTMAPFRWAILAETLGLVVATTFLFFLRTGDATGIAFSLSSWTPLPSLKPPSEEANFTDFALLTAFDTVSNPLSFAFKARMVGIDSHWMALWKETLPIVQECM